MAEEVVKTIENVDKLFSEIVVNGEVHKSNRYTSPSAQSASPSSVRSTQGEDVHAVELNDVLHNFSDPDVVSDVQALQQGLTNETNARYNADQNLQNQIDIVGGNVSTLQGKVNTIESEIPPQASPSNQLADKNFVNSSIATNTANFLGTYTSMADIEAIPNPTNNDYVFLQTTDSAGNNVFSRYKYNAEQEEWLYEYELNNSSFTAEQWATINSGLTQSSVTQEIEDAIAEYVYVSKLPTDAVLHYSFDEVPDYPDGSADLLQTQFTSTTGWLAGNGTTLSVENNSLKFETTGSLQYALATNNAFSGSTLKGKIVKVKVVSNDPIRSCYMQEQNPSTYPTYGLNLASQNGNEYIFCGLMPSDMTYVSYIVIQFTGTLKTAYIKSIYVGNGSYTTPVIDNANGQNNGTNIGGIAVQGVSGKGVVGLGKRNIVTNSTLPKPTDKSSITLSIWVKYTNSYSDIGSRNLFGTGSYNTAFCIFQCYHTSSNSMRLTAFVRQSSSQIATISVNVTSNEWHNAVMMWENKTLTFYVDGNKYTTSALSISDYTFGDFWRIGDTGIVQGNEPSPVGNIEYYVDDAQIFDRALSQEEVTALYFNRANTPKYFPQPTDKIEADNWNLMTSKGMYSAVTDFRSWKVSTPDYTKYILMADITTWYNSTSAQQQQAVSFLGMFVRSRPAGYTANATTLINMSINYYRNGQSLPNTQLMDLYKHNISIVNNINLCIIQYQNNIYLAIRLNTIQSADNYFFGRATQPPLLTLLSTTDTVTEIYVDSEVKQIGGTVDGKTLTTNGVYRVGLSDAPISGYGCILDVKSTVASGNIYVWQTAYMYVNDPNSYVASIFTREGTYVNDTWSWGTWSAVTNRDRYSKRTATASSRPSILAIKCNGVAKVNLVMYSSTGEVLEYLNGFVDGDSNLAIVQDKSANVTLTYNATNQRFHLECSFQEGQTKLITATSINGYISMFAYV